MKFKDGLVPPFFFERKSIGDCYGSMTSDYKRFKKEIIRAQEQGIILYLIIEGNLSKVLKGYKYSTVEAISIVRKLFTLYIRYGIRVVFAKDREEIATYITETFCALGRNYLRSKKESQKIKVK